MTSDGTAQEPAPARPGRTERNLERARLTLAVLIVAVLAAVFAIAFRGALGFVFRHVGGANDIVSALSKAPLAARLLLPALGGLLAGCIALLIARAPKGHGVGDVMEAVVLGRVRLSMRVTLLKSLASWFAIAAGGSIGREGPLIQFGGAAGQLVSDQFSLSKDRARVLIAAGTAAGFAAAYNTPFAALLFVLEVVAGVVVLETMVPAMVAVVIATALTREIAGEGPIYGQRAFVLREPAELIAFVGLGVLSAFAAQGFMRLLSFGEQGFSKIPMPYRAAVGGLLAGSIIVVLPAVAGNGFEPLNALLDAQLSVAFVGVLLLGKVLATTASVSSGSPGGVFTPSLLVGGAVGFVYSEVLRRVLELPVGSPGGYALVGMAAAVGASTHAPLMAAILVFELSGDYAIVLPLILATAVATAISRKLRADSIYMAELKSRGVVWKLTLEGRKVSE